ncbi:MAG: helix-turn-helix domain-containing protein [Hyphomicrobium sp.]
MSANRLALPDDDLLTRSEAAERLRISISTLERLALQGAGPAYSRLGNGKRNRVVYRRRDLEDWITAHRRTSTSEKGAA